LAEFAANPADPAGSEGDQKISVRPGAPQGCESEREVTLSLTAPLGRALFSAWNRDQFSCPSDAAGFFRYSVGPAGI